jgi:trimethylamine:corrinoid methyltransferase-like protein
LLNQGAGWLVAFYERMTIDAEMLQMMAAWMDCYYRQRCFGARGGLGGRPWGLFFRHGTHLARYEAAFYSSLLSDW